MAFDYKKEYKEFYLPKKKPEIVEVPAMNYIAVRGTGDPNQEDGDYKKSIGLLYAIAFTIKMSKRSGHQIDEESQLFRAILMPVFKDLHIDLVLQGHDHTYEVIGPVDPETKTPLLADIADVRSVAQDASTNMTGKEGGVFTTDNGSLYFVGATCGRKRYYPYSREEMDEHYEKTKVENYYDLFTGKFGQPGAPAYSEITVNADSMVVSTYKTSVFQTRQLYDQIVIKRNVDNTYLDIHTLPAETQNGVFKTLYKGQLLIAKGQDFYDLLGRKYSREQLEQSEQ